MSILGILGQRDVKGLKMSTVRETREITNNISEIILNGDVDFSSSHEIKSAIKRQIKTGRIHIILNFYNVNYVESSGLEIIEKAQEFLNTKNGNIYIVCPENQIKKVFEISGIDEYMNIFNNEQDALNFIK